MPFAPPPRVDTPRFQLRSWVPADAARLQDALDASEAHLRSWTPWVVDGRVPGLALAARLARHAEAFAAGTEWVYGMFAPGGEEVLGEVLGGCGLYPRVGPGALEIGYWLGAAHTGQGLATEAAAELTRLAFADPGIERLEIRCDPRNVASAGVPHRLGYRHVTTLVPAPGPAGHARVELMVWQLTRAEFGAPGG